MGQGMELEGSGGVGQTQAICGARGAAAPGWAVVCVYLGAGRARGWVPWDRGTQGWPELRALSFSCVPIVSASLRLQAPPSPTCWLHLVLMDWGVPGCGAVLPFYLWGSLMVPKDEITPRSARAGSGSFPKAEFPGLLSSVFAAAWPEHFAPSTCPCHPSPKRISPGARKQTPCPFPEV